MEVDANVVPLVEDYLETAAWSTSGTCFYFVFRFLCDGTRHSQPMMIVQLVVFVPDSKSSELAQIGAFHLKLDWATQNSQSSLQAAARLEIDQCHKHFTAIGTTTFLFYKLH